MTLSERSAQLQQLGALLADTVAGHGRVVLLSSVAGAGKTALLHEFREKLAHHDVAVLVAGCVRADRTIPFGLLTELFESPALGMQDRSQGLKLVDDCAAPPPLSQRHGSTQTALAERRVTRLFLEISQRRPLVICVDDVHNADPESVGHLLRLARRLHSARVMLVLTERTRPVVTHSRLHTELLGQPHVKALSLGPLSPHGVREMIAAAADAETADRLAAHYSAVTGGSPLLVTAMLQDHATAEDDDSAAGPAFGHAVLGCVHSADPAMLSVSRAIALLDESATRARLSTLLDLPLETVRLIVAELTTIGLVTGCRIRRRAAARVIVADMADQERVDWHEHAARLLAESSASATAVAHHLSQAHTASEPWMINALVDAADALLDTDVQRAKAYLELARRFVGTDEQHAGVTMVLTRVELRQSPTAALRLRPQLVEAVGKGHVPERLALQLPELLYWFGRAEDNERLYRDLSGQVGTEDSRMAMELSAYRMLLVTVFPQLTERLPDVLDQVSGVGLASAAFTTSIRLTIFANLSAVLRKGPGADAVRDAEHVLNVTRLSDGTAALLTAAVITLAVCGEVRSAEKWADRLLAKATERGAANWQGMMAAQRAQIALRRGDLPAAERYGRLALDCMPPQVWGVAVGSVYATLLRAYTEMGSHADAVDLLSRPLPEALFHSVHGLQYLYAKGHYYLATHHHQAAYEDFRACGELISRWGLDHSAVVPWRCGAAEALLRQGIPGGARRLAEEQLSLLTADHPIGLRGTALRILAATRPHKQRVQLLGEAVEVLQRSADRLELAKALTDLGRAHQRLGESALARMTARRAWHTATECHAMPLADGAYACSGVAPDNALRTEEQGERASGTGEDGAEPGAAPGAAWNGAYQSANRTGREPEQGVDRGRQAEEPLRHLTDAERRVCVLAGQGLTNREISDQLFITVSTVEQHLTRIYRKLRVKRRQDLPAEPKAGQPQAVPSTTAAPEPPRLRPIAPVTRAAP